MIINQIIPEKIYIENGEELKELEEILKQNNLKSDNKLKVNSWAVISKKDKYYIVKPTDTIPSVAKTLNISEQELLNKIGTKNVYIGQKIKL